MTQKVLQSVRKSNLAILGIIYPPPRKPPTIYSKTKTFKNRLKQLPSFWRQFLRVSNNNFQGLYLNPTGLSSLVVSEKLLNLQNSQGGSSLMNSQASVYLKIKQGVLLAEVHEGNGYILIAPWIPTSFWHLIVSMQWIRSEKSCLEITISLHVFFKFSHPNETDL